MVLAQKNFLHSNTGADLNYRSRKIISVCSAKNLKGCIRVQMILPSESKVAFTTTNPLRHRWRCKPPFWFLK